jgi:hypothetical protein
MKSDIIKKRKISTNILLGCINDINEISTGSFFVIIPGIRTIMLSKMKNRNQLFFKYFNTHNQDYVDFSD